MARPQPRAEPSLPDARARAPRAAFAWFGGEVGAWFGAWGMQHVLFSWLVVGELREDPEWVGTAQMCQQLPALLLLLWGGATADRLDRRRVLRWTHGAAALAALGLAVVVRAGVLSFPVLVVYALVWGVLQAFGMPARDALLYEVAGRDIERGVTRMTLIQFSAQALGARLAGAAQWLGSPLTLGLQAGVLAAGLASLVGLRRPLRAVRAAAPPGPSVGEAPRSALHAIAEGLREVWRSPELRPLAAMAVSNGLFFVGPFFVLFPLLLRDVYDAGVREFGLLLMMFPLGAITGSVVLLAAGGVRRRGTALLVGLFCGGACIAAVYLELPFRGLLATVYAWGLCGAVFLNMSRTLFQRFAPESHRARVLSVYSLGLMGSGPVSSLACGFLADWIGPLACCLAAGLAMMVAVAFAATFTRIGRFS